MTEMIKRPSTYFQGILNELLILKTNNIWTHIKLRRHFNWFHTAGVQMLSLIFLCNNFLVSISQKILPCCYSIYYITTLLFQAHCVCTFNYLISRVWYNKYFERFLTPNLRSLRLHWSTVSRKQIWTKETMLVKNVSNSSTNTLSDCLLNRIL